MLCICVVQENLFVYVHTHMYIQYIKKIKRAHLEYFPIEIKISNQKSIFGNFFSHVYLDA